jgi:hypothetical protein
LNPGDSGQLEGRQRRHGVAQDFALDRFHRLLETQIAELQASHEQKLANTSNPLNLGKLDGRRRRFTRGLHGMASYPEKKVSGSLRRRMAGGKRRIRGRGGARRRLGEGGGAPGKFEGRG